jgi:hypothetical protein
MGAKSRFWALEDDDDSDEEVMSQSPLTPDLVRHAAVHGFSKAQLYDAEMAMQDLVGSSTSRGTCDSGFHERKSGNGQEHYEGADRCAVDGGEAMVRAITATKGLTDDDTR